MQDEKQRRKPTWSFRPPAARHDELFKKALKIAEAKGLSDGTTTGFNKLVASYVADGIDRDWASMVETGGHGGGKTAVEQKLQEAGFVSAKSLPAPKLGTADASRVLTHDVDAVLAKDCAHPVNRRLGTYCAACGKDPVR